MPIPQEYRIHAILNLYGRHDLPVDDARLRNVRTEKDRYVFPAPRSREAWEARASDLQQQILTACGLRPEPKRRELSPRVTGRTEGDGFTVENIFFESLPGFYVTGNLYLPRAGTERKPGILCPHGHWEHGRLEHSGRGSVPARCAHLARMGCVVFSYDMVGYVDSLQVGHGGFGSFLLDLWGINLMGLQLWNSLRSVDFLASRPEVDPQNLACTGASGGGTQTYMLAAIDGRIRAAAPVNMVSAHYQGGCLCENAPLLRLDTCNVEIAAMIAPRPLLLVSCTGDWTRNTPSVEYPAIRRVYELYGCQERVEQHQVHAEHNYNLSSRRAVYRWFARHLLDRAGSDLPAERPLDLDLERLRVFPDDTLPTDSLTAGELYPLMIRRRKKRLAEAWPETAVELEGFRKRFGKILAHTLATSRPRADDLQERVIDPGDPGSRYRMEKMLISRRERGDAIPALFLSPGDRGKGEGGADAGASGRSSAPEVVAVFSDRGKSGLYNPRTGELEEPLHMLLRRGASLLLCDLFLTGEHHRPEGLTGRDLRATNHFTTYNRTDLAERVQDMITIMSWLYHRKGHRARPALGLGDAGPWLVLARGVAPDLLSAAAVDMGGFDPSCDTDYLRRAFAPGLLAAGGLSTAAALAAPRRLLVFRSTTGFPGTGIRHLYELLGAEENLRKMKGTPSPGDLAEFLR